jgi:DNA-directed RNA polymerase subunit RPC12/RpoP
MVRVVNPPPEEKVTCYNCKADLAFNEGDMRRPEDVTPSMSYQYIVCPVCGHKIKVGG